jgi:hypothetical protein
VRKAAYLFVVLPSLLKRWEKVLSLSIETKPFKLAFLSLEIPEFSKFSIWIMELNECSR